MADTTKFVQAQEFTLSASGLAIGATSITLNSFKQIDGSTNLTMTDFGTVGYGTLSPNTSREEQISFTGITQNGNGTATLTGVKTVLNVDPYTETSGVTKSQAGNAVFVISNTAGFYSKLLAKGNDETITGVYTFTSTAKPKYNTHPTFTADEEIVDKKYVDGVAIAGAPDASTSTKGIAKLSTAPASPTDPIAVGTNDTRMPTQGENDALAGSSGTPSSSNKYITQNDVSNAGASDKVVRAIGTELPALDASSLTNVNISKTYIAGESISTNDAVTIGFYQSDGGIIYDNKATDISSISSSGGNRSFNYTVGTGSDRMLVVFFALGASTGSVGSPTSVTYGSSSMTLARTESNSSSNVLYCYYLKNPSSGSNSLVITVSASSGATQYISTCVVSYSQVDTISTVQGTNNGGGGYTTLNSTYTVGTTNMVIVSGAFVSGATGFTANALSNGQSTGSNSLGWCVSGDSGKAVESGTITTTNSTNLICLGLLPKTPVSTTVAVVFKSSASNKINGVNDDRYTKFIGIAKNSASTGQNVSVLTNGIAKGFSGLSINKIYFLNNTDGTVGVGAGDNSKKIGISISSTEILLKDAI